MSGERKEIDTLKKYKVYEIIPLNILTNQIKRALLTFATIIGFDATMIFGGSPIGVTAPPLPFRKN